MRLLLRRSYVQPNIILDASDVAREEHATTWEQALLLTVREGSGWDGGASRAALSHEEVR